MGHSGTATIDRSHIDLPESTDACTVRQVFLRHQVTAVQSSTNAEEQTS